MKIAHFDLFVIDPPETLTLARMQYLLHEAVIRDIRMREEGREAQIGLGAGEFRDE